MKRVLLAAAAVCFLGVPKLFAQQEPKYTHFMFNQLNYNPAYAGTRDGICASILYHNQWTGFKDVDGGVSPVTQTFSVHSPLPMVGVKNGIAQGNMGVGLNIINDKLGFMNSMGVNLAGSYIFKHLWSAVSSVSVGINLGMMQESLDPKWVAKDPSDPRLPGTSSSTVFDAGAGVYVTSLNWFAGLSSTHISQSKAKWETQTKTGTVEFPLKSYYYLTGGYMYPVGSNLEIQGYGLLESDMVKNVVSLSALALYQKMIYGGINVRFEKLTAASLMVGYYPKISKGSLLIGLGWDIPTGYAKYFGGTPEIFARYCFNLNLEPVEPVWHKSSRWL